jgi:autophagy-related protein 9
VIWSIAWISKATRIRKFFLRALKIKDSQIQTIPWHLIVKEIEQYQRITSISLVKDHNALDIANRILRKENFLIALLNHVSEDGKSLIPTHFRIGNLGIPLIGKSLEFNLRYVVLNSMFSSQFELRPSFWTNHQSLAQRFYLAGIVNLILLPFIFLYLAVFLFLKHFESFYSNRSSLLTGDRTSSWTPYALWKVREYNELNHSLRQRLDSPQVHDLAIKFLEQFPNYLRATVFKLVSFVSASFVSFILIILALADSTTLAEFHVLGRSLVWYLALFSGILALSRPLSRAPHACCNPEEIMQELYQYTHYFPSAWKGRCHEPWVLREFQQMYAPKISIFVQELISVLVTPFFLIFVFPSRAAQIASFVKDHRKHVKGLGDICSFACFEESGEGIELEELKESKSIDNVLDKISSSMLSFLLEHPQWKDSGAISSRLASMDPNSVHPPTLSDSDLLLHMTMSRVMEPRLLDQKSSVFKSILRSRSPKSAALTRQSSYESTPR